MWKDITGFEGLYQVSDKGEVKRLESYKKHSRSGELFKLKERILKQSKDKDGYLLVGLKDVNGKMKSYRVHRLVAQAFIPNTNNLEQVNHIDENKLNNEVSNLEWCSSKYNVNFGLRTTKQVESQSKQVVQMLNNQIINKYPSMNEAARALGHKNGGAISSCINGKTKTAFGYTWKLI